MNNIQVVQGDSLELDVNIRNLNTEKDIISEIWFTSEELGIRKTLEKITASKFFLSMDPNETKILKDGIFSYDLTIFFKGEKVNTSIYKGSFKVLKKVNVV